jgi:hypothetical protein
LSPGNILIINDSSFIMRPHCGAAAALFMPQSALIPQPDRAQMP